MIEKSTAEKIADDERQFIARKGLFEPMLLTPAWKELEAILQAQHAGQLQNLLAPPKLVAGNNETAVAVDGLAQALLSEYQKGVVFGIQLTLKTPYATIASANEIISLRQTKEKETADASRTRSTSVDDDGNRLPDGATVTDLGG